MIATIIGIVGLAGGGGIAALVAKFGLKVVLGNVGGFFKGLPSWAWIAAAAVAALVGGTFLHQHKAHQHDTALVKVTIAKRDGQWMKRLADEHAAGRAWKGQAEAQLTKVAQLQRKLTDEETARIAADATALRLRGAGKAAAPAGCRPVDPARLPAATGGHVAQPGPAADAGTEVPAGDGQDQWAIVPWDWLVDVVSERDAFRVEAIGWRGYQATVTGVWNRLKAEAPGTKKGAGVPSRPPAGD
jgi:hypothetical protein